MRCFARYETEDIFTPDRLAAQVRSQVNHRAVAAGTGHQVTVQPFAGAGDFVGTDVDRGNTCPGDALAAAGLDHGAAGEDANALGAGFFHQRTTRVAARIGNGHHLQAGVEPVQGHAIGMVVVGAQHQFLARCHAVATHVGGHRTGQHVARHVVVAVDQRTLAGAGRQDHALGADAVDALADLADGRSITEVVGKALMDGQEVMVVVTVHRGARQQHHFWHRAQFSHRRSDPFDRRLAVQALAGVEQAAAELFLLIGQDDARTAAGRGQCGGQAGRASADDQHVAVAVHVVVGVRIVLGRRATQAGSLADVLLVGHPERLRVHEGFVVEARRHQFAADLAENAHHVVVHVRPAVGAGGDQTLVQRLLRGAHVRDLCGFGGTDLQHGVRLFGTGGEDAARTRILEAAANDVDTVGQQRSGQGIALEAFVGLAVEGEAQRFVAVDPSTVGQAIDLAHTFSPRACAAAFGLSALSVNCGFWPIL